VRDAAQNIIMWALLTCPDKPPAIDWTQVFAHDQWPEFTQDMPGSTYPGDWIGNQYYYFRQREEQRHSKGQLFEVLSWSLFTTPGFLAVLLLMWFAPGRKWPPVFDRLVEPGLIGQQIDSFLHFASTLGAWSSGLMALVCLSAASGFWWIRGCLRHQSARLLSIVVAVVAAILIFITVQFVAASIQQEAARELHLVYLLLAALYGVYWLWKVLPDANAARAGAAAVGLGAAILFALALQAGAARLAGLNFEDTAKNMTMVLVVFLPALAGGLRFLSEKLAIEAEALSYREARHWFEHAADLLQALRPGNGDGAADERARNIIRRIGILALSENEAWLKSRRERPLSPVIGG
jgi:hypothetical protein